jgi:CRISPR-associated protein Cas2
MYIILVYDIGEKRVQKVHKLLKKYLNWVQNSVFEGELTEGKFEAMKIDLKTRMKPDEDSLIIYTLGSLKYTGREIIGVEKNLTGNLL